MAFDVNTMFFDTETALTATATSSAMDFHGPDLAELAYRFVANGECSGSIVPTLETSDDGETYETEYEFPEITEAEEVIVKYRCKKKYRRMKVTVSGSFEHFEAGIDSGARGKIL